MQPGQNFNIAIGCAHPLTIRLPSFKFLSQPKFGSQSFEKRSSKAKFCIFGTLLLATQLIYGVEKNIFGINSKHGKNTKNSKTQIVIYPHYIMTHSSQIQDSHAPFILKFQLIHISVLFFFYLRRTCGGSRFP
jgi:hypothetical protein